MKDIITLDMQALSAELFSKSDEYPDLFMVSVPINMNRVTRLGSEEILSVLTEMVGKEAIFIHRTDTIYDSDKQEVPMPADLVIVRVSYPTTKVKIFYFNISNEDTPSYIH